MRVVTHSGGRPSVGDSLIRNGWRVFSGLVSVVVQTAPDLTFVGAIIVFGLAISIATSGSRGAVQAWNDRMAGCYVVNKGF